MTALERSWRPVWRYRACLCLGFAAFTSFATAQVAGSPTIWISCVHGKKIFTYTGSNQTFTLPALACPTVTFKVWGAGGGAGSGGPSLTSSGGGGGYATGRVIANPGQTFTLVVGGGGLSGDGSRLGGYGGGASGGAGSQGFGTFGGGGGGGLSGVFSGSFGFANAMIVAGGGGGGGPIGYQGGAGGGTTGAAGYGNYWTQATGGTQSTGGLGGILPNINCTGEVFGSDGKALAGGAGGGGAQYGGGGGGGGYYGGGGGGSDNGGMHVNQVSCAIHPWGQSGGGGSGFTGYTGLLNAGLTGGSGRAAANTNDPEYESGVGMGGLGSSSDLDIRSGSNGLIVVLW